MNENKTINETSTEAPKRADGNIIYQPRGRAGEYSRWAANLFNGCTNQCAYCYNRRGYMNRVAGIDHPVLKKTAEDAARSFQKRYGAASLEDAVMGVFQMELAKWGQRIKEEGGLMLSFTTDPMLEEELPLTMRCLETCVRMGIPVSVLTKCTSWVTSDGWKRVSAMPEAKKLIAVGFTLTGMDELESGAPSNGERIRAMRSVACDGFTTFASVEPVVDLQRAQKVINDSLPFCRHFKVGLLRGKKDYDAGSLATFVKAVNGSAAVMDAAVYWKDSVREFLPEGEYDARCCVEEDYSVFDKR